MNEILYVEVQADDPERAMRFYETVFGWQFPEQSGHPIDYWHITGAGLMGGLLKRPGAVPEGPAGTNAFTCSVRVDDFDATAAAIAATGGTVALPKFAIPGRCWQGYFVDTEGNTFGVFQPDDNAA